MMKIVGLLFVSCLLFFTACDTKHPRSDAYGTFTAEKIMVSAMANGKIVYTDYREGAILEKGTLVAIVDTTDLVLQIKQLHSRIKAVNTQLGQIDAQADVQQQQMTNLSLDIQRVQRLIPDGAATQKQLDDLQGAMRLLEKQRAATLSQKEAIRAEINSLRVQEERTAKALKDCYVYNPSPGTVLAALAHEGELATFGRALYTLSDLSVVELKAFVSGAQLPGIAIGQKVEVLVDDRAANQLRKMPGEVVYIAESAEFTPKIIQTREDRVTLVYAVKVRVVNDGSLKIGMPGEVNF
ncbi:MAG: HlyD family secretion protein [Bacteroidetes bacterium]|nr:MAG: HlyD family secretion protein [Bacteroidota bacterium]